MPHLHPHHLRCQSVSRASPFLRRGEEVVEKACTVEEVQAHAHHQATCHHLDNRRWPLPHRPHRIRRATMMVPSGHAYRPMAGQRKPTGAKPLWRGGGCSSPYSFTSLLASVPCVFFLPVLPTAACKQVPPAAHGRKAVHAASLCFIYIYIFFFFFIVPTPPKVYREPGHSSIWRPDNAVWAFLLCRQRQWWRQEACT